MEKSRIGALVRHKTCERSPILRGRFGTLGTAAGLIADPVVRNRGDCLRLAHADPQGDWASALLAVGADVEVRSASGERTIPLEDFISGPFTTALEPNELVTGVTVRDPGAKAAGTYLKLERKVGDFATVGVAVHVSFDDGVVRRGRDRAHRRCPGKRPRDRGRGVARRQAAERRDDRGGCAARRGGRESAQRRSR